MSSDVASQPLTPDFYAYPWVPLVDVRRDGDFVVVSWADGTRLRCYASWLAENTSGMGLETLTREGMIDPAHLPEPGQLTHTSLGKDGALELAWADGRRGTVHPGWLRHVADQQHRPHSYLPEPQPWTTATFSEPPTVDGADVLTDASVLAEWLNLLATYGLARLTNTAAAESWLPALAEQIGPVRGSNFGDFWSVRLVQDPNSTANTALGLGQHSDLPTRETPPGFQFLHCVANTVQGGLSRMTDGLSLVTRLQTEHGEAYDALTTLNWVFFNRDVGADHRWSGPIIDHGAPGQPLTLRAFYPVRAFPDMDEADIARAYAALRVFSQLAQHPDLQISYPFSPGDLVAFDNRRLLHGRDAFDPGDGQRHLQGCYIDQDDLYSRLRVLNRANPGWTKASTPVKKTE